jgi:hypothetical protein
VAFVYTLLNGCLRQSHASVEVATGNHVVSNAQSFATTKVLVTRVVFEDGKLGNILRDGKIQSADGH